MTLKKQRVDRIIKLVNSVEVDEPGDKAKLEYVKPIMVLKIRDTGGDWRKLESLAFSIIQAACDLAKRDLLQQSLIYLKISGVIVDTIKTGDQ